MFKDLTLNLPEEDYRNIPCISYSFVSKFYRDGYSEIGNLLTSISSPSLSMGSLVDCLLTDKDNFYSRYYIISGNVPTDAIVEIVKEILFMDGKVHSSLEECLPTTIINAANKFSYYTNWKDETRIKNIIEKGAAYYSKLLEADNRIIVSEEDFAKAGNSCRAIMGKFSYLFAASKNREVLYQAQFKNDFYALENWNDSYKFLVKGMMDCVVVDNEYKHITIYDFKTTSSPEYMFINSYFKWGYYFQSYIYKKLIEKAIIDTDYRHYDVNMHFVVVNPNNPHPLLFDDTLYSNMNVVELGIPNIQYIINQADIVYKHITKEETTYILPSVYNEDLSNNIFQIMNNCKNLNIKIK